MPEIAIQVRYCASCQTEVTMEQPECRDGHGSGCPEWFCVQCGDAFVAGFTSDLDGALAAGRRRSHRVA